MKNHLLQNVTDCNKLKWHKILLQILLQILIIEYQ